MNDHLIDVQSLHTPRLEELIDSAESADMTLMLIFEHPDLKYPEAVSQVREALDAFRIRATVELVRRTATPEHPWYVTDECGELIAKVLGAAPYKPYSSDNEYYGELNHNHGFEIEYVVADHFRAAGTREIVNGLTDDDDDWAGVGRGPWDGQHYTISRTMPKPVPEFTDEEIGGSDA